MTESGKKRLLIIVGLVALAMLLVAASLSQMELRPGLPLPSLEGGRLVAPSTPEIPVVQITINDFFRTVLSFLIAVMALYVAFRMFKGTPWKKLSSYFLQSAFIILIVMGTLALMISLMPTSTDLPITLPLAPTPEPEVTTPLGTPPLAVKWLAAIGLAISITIAGMWFFNLVTQSNTNPNLIELEAEKARLELLAGNGLASVVLRCYQQMSLALQKEQGIEREIYMTTGEFENLLVARGFPSQPVHQLTQLFEAVRYGHWQSNADDEQKALDSLTAIVKHSQERKKPGK